MAVTKVSVSLDEEVAAAARERVGARGMSGYVNEAVRRQLRRDALGDLLDAMHTEHGPADPDAMDEVRRAWPAAGGQ